MRERVVEPVVVKGVRIGEGLPTIVVPVSGADPERLRAEVDALPGHHVDVVEWRVDHFGALSDTAAVVAAARMLAGRLAGMPLLATCRTRAEGGRATFDDRRYGELLVALAESGAVDLVDVEYARAGAVVEDVIAAARAGGVAVIASYHDFDATPPKDEIVARLRAMQGLGADICKIAVMPRSPADVLVLLDATLTMRERYAERPLITISMGPLGVVSRLAGGLVGSAATFGMVGTPSAPGQVAVDDLHAAMVVLGPAG